MDTTELEVHLIDCAACRQAFNQYNFVGERLRSLPPIEPPPDAYSRLMQSLAVEHSRFLQYTLTASQPIPAFLLPYLQGQVQGARQTDALTAFSTAETGPLPIIHPQARRQPFSRTNHFAILGLAAAFLMVMMMSGLTSLLLLASHGGARSAPSSDFTSHISRPSQVAMATYTATTAYPHVASAVADQNYIYYTAYGDNNTGWMLSAVNRKTQLSTPLLSTTSTSPLIVLGSSQNWLLWLEFDTPVQTTSKVSPGQIQEGHNVTRKWSLNALSIGQDQATTLWSLQPLTLLKDTFDETAVPDWVHTPIQGVWFTQDGLLVATVDAKGKAHLLQYQLMPGKNFVASEIATASDGHIITSPTATSDGTSIFWSEEWFTNDGAPHGNIWTQQVSNSLPGPGHWLPHKEVTKSLFRSDEMSFHPQVVDNTLFLLSTNSAGTSTTSANATATAGPQATPNASASATAGTTATPAAVSDLSNTPVLARSDPQLYAPQPDQSIKGTLQAYSLTDYLPLQLPFDTNGQASAPQGGSRFLFWQDNDKGFQMYDVVAGQPVTVGSATVPKNADFLAVNGDTAVWTLSASLDNNTTSNQASAPNLSVTFMAFNWPDKPAMSS